MSSKEYRAARQNTGLQTNTPARLAIYRGKAASGVSALRSAAIAVQVDALVHETVLRCEAWALAHLKIADPVGYRLDWTHRTETAEKPRSRGGRYAVRFLSIDDDAERITSGGYKRMGVSLRLAQYIKPSTDLDGQMDWNEYSALHLHPLVGSRRTTARGVIGYLVAHEVAHAYQAELALRGLGSARERFPDLGEDEIQPDTPPELQALVDAYGVENYVRVAAIETTPWCAHSLYWQSIYSSLRTHLALGGDLFAVEDALPSQMTSAHLRGWTGGGTRFVCEQCGKEGRSQKIAHKGGGRKPRFCSSSCRGKSRRSLMAACVGAEVVNVFAEERAARQRLLTLNGKRYPNVLSAAKDLGVSYQALQLHIKAGNSLSTALALMGRRVERKATSRATKAGKNAVVISGWVWPSDRAAVTYFNCGAVPSHQVVLHHREKAAQEGWAMSLHELVTRSRVQRSLRDDNRLIDESSVPQWCLPLDQPRVGPVEHWDVRFTPDWWEAALAEEQSLPLAEGERS